MHFDVRMNVMIIEVRKNEEKIFKVIFQKKTFCCQFSNFSTTKSRVKKGVIRKIYTYKIHVWLMWNWPHSKIKTSRAKIPFIYLNGNMKKRLLLWMSGRKTIKRFLKHFIEAASLWTLRRKPLFTNLELMKMPPVLLGCWRNFG